MAGIRHSATHHMVEAELNMDRDEQVRRNLEHAFDFLDAIIDESARLARIPDGANVVFMPDDDPELRAANMELVGGSVGQTITVPTSG